jgi:hypothetical protein
MRAPGVFIASAGIVLIASVTLLLVCTGPSDAVYIGSDWVVDTDLTYENDVVTVRGHINIKSGGSLTLLNSTLEVDSREGSIKTLTVESTGNLYCYNSTIKNRYDYRYFFNVWNDTVFKDTTIRQLFGWNRNPGGIRLLGGNSHIFEKCLITDSSSYGIWTRCPLDITETTISGTSWTRLQVDTDGQLRDFDFYIQNCTFIGRVSNPYSTGVALNDGYGGGWRRYVNISNCVFEGITYGINLANSWRNAYVDINHNVFDRCTIGARVYVYFLDVNLDHNSYTVRGGGYGIYLYQGSYGNITMHDENIRAASLGDGTGLYLRGAGSVHHKIHDLIIWNTYYGIVNIFGPATIRDCYINTTNVNFYVTGGASFDVYTTEHTIGSGFVENTGGEIRAWQRLNISSVRWADGAPVTQGLMYILNGTNDTIATINLTMGENYVEFQRWLAKRAYLHINTVAVPALLDIDTFFFASELDILRTDPQEIVFTDDYIPRITLPGYSSGHHVNRTYMLLEGDVIERGRGIARIEVKLDDNTPGLANYVGEKWDFAFLSLADGVYDLKITALDKAGNGRVLVFTGIIVDTMPPMIVFDTPVPPATNWPILTLNGTTEPGATLYLGSLTITPDENGRFGFEYPLTEGSNGLVLLVQDRVGNWNQSVFSVYLDTITPILTVTSPEDGIIINQPVVFLSGRTDNDAEVTVNGKVVPVSKGSFATEMELPEGVNDLVVRAVDLSGNFAERTLTITVDTTPPMLIIDSPAGNSARTVDDTFFIAGRMDEEISNVFIDGDNRSTLPGEFAVQVPIKEGDNTFTVVVVDLAGNRNEAIVVITRDTQAPDYRIEVTVKDGTIVQSGTERFATEDTLLFHITVDEKAIFKEGNNVHTGTGTLQFEVTLEEGRNDITVAVEDELANVAEPFQYTVTYDPTPPDIIITSPQEGFVTEDAELQITGITDGGEIKVWVADVPAGVRADGSFEIIVTLDHGDNTFRIKARDKAGNVEEMDLTVKRKKTEEVADTSIGMYAVFLIVGLVIGIVLMMVRGAMGKGGGTMPEPMEPDVPPEEPPKRPKGGWEEY